MSVSEDNKKRRFIDNCKDPKYKAFLKRALNHVAESRKKYKEDLIKKNKEDLKRS